MILRKFIKQRKATFSLMEVRREIWRQWPVCAVSRDKILIARNCHKSVYHGVELLGLDPVYVYPKINEDGMCEGITKDQISRVLREEKGIKAAVIVSPTYEGVVSDIKEIADMLHSQGILLIVDEAHGAHFPFYEGFPKSAVFQGQILSYRVCIKLFRL